jgi:hypothetical protein
MSDLTIWLAFLVAVGFAIAAIPPPKKKGRVR